MAYTRKNLELYKRIQGLINHRHYAWDADDRWYSSAEEGRVSFRVDPEGFFVGTVEVHLDTDDSYRIEFFFGKVENGRVRRWKNRGAANHIVRNVQGEDLAYKIDQYFGSFKDAAA